MQTDYRQRLESEKAIAKLVDERVNRTKNELAKEEKLCDETLISVYENVSKQIKTIATALQEEEEECSMAHESL